VKYHTHFTSTSGGCTKNHSRLLIRSNVAGTPWLAVPNHRRVAERWIKWGEGDMDGTFDREEGLADASGSHHGVSGKNRFCHTLVRVNTV
jgi:hypothetical protein